MDEEEPMDTSETQFYWYFLADCLRWHRFEDFPLNPISSECLEHHYFRRLSQTKLDFYTSIDFSAMKHTDLRTGKERRIQRSPVIIDKSCSCFIAAPVFWEKHDPTSTYQLIPLVQQSDEYQTVEKYTIKDKQYNNIIVSIKRIQNVDLWEFYCRKKIQLMKIHGIRHTEERHLFHGTSSQNIDSICKFNFELGHPGKNGHKYGKGIYFAKKASKAAQYSIAGVLPGSSRGLPTKVMFLAGVIVGTSTMGRPLLPKPDDGNQSSVNNTAKPTIFVIFNPNQIYPEYLIEYK